MRIRILTLDQINKQSPHKLGRVFDSVFLFRKGSSTETHIYDYWGAVLGRWYILIKRKAVEI
jgi:hypothetical protein